MNVGRSYGIVHSLSVRFSEPNALPTVPPDDGYEERLTDTVLRANSKKFDGILPFTMPSKIEGQIIYGYVLYEDVFYRMWRNRFAVAVWSYELPGRHFYQTVGGSVYNRETLERDRPK